MEILGCVVLPGWLLWILIFVFSICVYASYKQSYFSRLGIPQKSTVLLLGDLPDAFRKGFGYIDADMVKKNGKYFGCYFGCVPCLVISDLDMLKEIMVKQFSNFTDRVISIPIEKKWNSSLTIATGDHWKFIRQTLSPTFSSGKLRHISPYIQRCLNNLMEIMEEKRQIQGDGFDIDPIIRGCTLDVICTTGFGVHIDSQRNLDNLYIKYVKEVVEINVTGSPLFLISFLFPDLKFLLDKMEVPLISKKAFDFFETETTALFEERKIDSSGHRDLLQLMINSNKLQGEINSTTNGYEDTLTYEDYRKRGLTDNELLINTMVFMSAGYETTASTLGWLIYDLCLHPDVQDKVIAEIDAQIGKEKPTYDSAFKLKYLDMVVNETLRMHPPATRVDREASRDTWVCGRKIKKGMNCTVSILALHYMPEYWTEPQKYDPERFSEANKASINPFAYLPFGRGPRHCIGQRLALLEVKMTMIAILQRYKVIRSEKLKVPMPSTKIVVNRAAEPLYIKLEPRNIFS